MLLLPKGRFNMRRVLSTEDIAKLTVADAAAAWKTQSEKLDHRHCSYPYVFQPQYNSSVEKFLPRALDFLADKGNVFNDHIVPVPQAVNAGYGRMLVAIFDHDTEDIAKAARAAFLHERHGYDLHRAYTLSSAELGLDRNTAKSANNVAEAVRRLIRFFRTWLTTCSTVLIDSQWPATPADLKRSKASVLVGRIRREMIGRGVLDPRHATPKMIAEALRSYTDKSHSTGDVRHWNSSLRDLVAAVKDNQFAGITEEHLSELAEVRTNPRNPAMTISEEELTQLWPEYFPSLPGDKTHLDPEQGMPGYFNKLLAAEAPSNPAGHKCPRERQLHRNAHTNRFRSIRRYLYRIIHKIGCENGGTITLRDAFEPRRIREWLEAEIKAKGKVHHSHKDGYMHSLMVSKHYFGHDVADLESWSRENVQFPGDWESTRGEQALRNGNPKTLVEQAEAMGRYATSSLELSSKKAGLRSTHSGAGHYLLRKSGEIDCWLRLLTGLRPGALDELEVANSPDRTGCAPAIWFESKGYYILFVPLRWMKQHLVNIWGKNNSKRLDLDSATGEVKGFEFEIHRPEAVSALSDYLREGWPYAKAVQEKRTRKLYLNSKGEPFQDNGFAKAFTSLRAEVRHFIHKSEGREITDHTRYQHRHIMATFVETHLPGHGLKTTYLTHSSDFGSNALYGKTNMTLLREVIDELLDGKPTRLTQQELREKERDEQLVNLQKQLEEMMTKLNDKAS